MSILTEIPLGRHKMDTAMKLREVMLINGILYNSEAWHGVTQKNIKTLQSIDEDFLRRIMKAHGKTPTEFLYLETGALPIQWIIAQRRINSLKCLFSKDSNELVRKVLEAQRTDPTSGDFIKLVEKDMLDLNVTWEQVEKSSKDELKKILKTNATIVGLTALKHKQVKHKKIKHIKYESL